MLRLGIVLAVALASCPWRAEASASLAPGAAELSAGVLRLPADLLEYAAALLRAGDESLKAQADLTRRLAALSEALATAGVARVQACLTWAGMNWMASPLGFLRWRLPGERRDAMLQFAGHEASGHAHTMVLSEPEGRRGGRVATVSGLLRAPPLDACGAGVLRRPGAMSPAPSGTGPTSRLILGGEVGEQAGLGSTRSGDVPLTGVSVAGLSRNLAESVIDTSAGAFFNTANRFLDGIALQLQLAREGCAESPGSAHLVPWLDELTGRLELGRSAWTRAILASNGFLAAVAARPDHLEHLTLTGIGSAVGRTIELGDGPGAARYRRSQWARLQTPATPVSGDEGGHDAAASQSVFAIRLTRLPGGRRVVIESTHAGQGQPWRQAAQVVPVQRARAR